MKKDLRKAVPKLELKDGYYDGGFSALSAEQLHKLKGGSNTNCTLCSVNNVCLLENTDGKVTPSA